MRTVQTLLFVLMAAGILAAEDQPTPNLHAAQRKQLDPIEQDLLSAVKKIAAKRGVALDEVRRVFATMNCNSQCITKGGVGLVRDRVFVVAGSEKNEAIVAEDSVVGADFEIPELFVFSGGRFIGRVPVPSGSANDVIVVLFSPGKIQFYDWKDLKGGYFKRWREDKPNQP